MGKVVRLHTNVQIAPGPLFEAAWKAFPDTGRMRSSRKLASVEWARAACEVGEQTLLAAVLRYARDDKDHKKEHGAPGFHRWLSMGRWEYWVEAEKAVKQGAKRFPDRELRASFFARFSDDRARRWFDRCGWRAADREIVSDVRTLRKEWLDGPFSRWARENGIVALVSD